MIYTEQKSAQYLSNLKDSCYFCPMNRFIAIALLILNAVVWVFLWIASVPFILYTALKRIFVNPQ